MVDIIIDGFTDCLEDGMGGVYDTEYRLVQQTITKAEAMKLKKDGWAFDWSDPQRNGFEVYQLFVCGDDTIQGMIALKHNRDDLFTEVDIVESAPHNRGKNKKYIGVGPHLFAIACKLSWETGNDGFVVFIAKTNLVEHYIKTLNAKNISYQKMMLDSFASLELVKKYFGEGEQE